MPDPKYRRHKLFGNGPTTVSGSTVLSLIARYEKYRCWASDGIRQIEEKGGGVWHVLRLSSAGVFYDSLPWYAPPHFEFAKSKSQEETKGRKRADYGFGEHGFKHRTQWVFRGSLSSGERAQWVPLSLLFVCQSELTEFFAELTEFAVELSEFSLPKQYSRNSSPPVS